MKVTRQQLRRIIREVGRSEHDAEARGMAASYQRGYDDGYETPQQPASTGRDPEYLRGYEKGAADAEDGAPQMREATYDQLPYNRGGPWVDKSAPVKRGPEIYDDLDMELSDKEIEDAMGWEPAEEYDEGDGDYAEYDRGYQDGLDGVPADSSYSTDYDVGYEDGQLDATLPDQLNEDDRPWGSYATKKDDHFSDTIVMSPHGDSFLVDGLETYVQDVPSQLEYASGFEMDPTIGDVLMTELERQEQEGYVELPVEYKNGQWEIGI